MKVDEANTPFDTRHSSEQVVSSLEKILDNAPFE